ncbi:MAG: hypothetical protein ABF384_06345 [Verrucomicrobiales bacterium]
MNFNPKAYPGESVFLLFSLCFQFFELLRIESFPSYHPDLGSLSGRAIAASVFFVGLDGFVLLLKVGYDPQRVGVTSTFLRHSGDYQVDCLLVLVDGEW